MQKHFQFLALVFVLFASTTLFGQPPGPASPRPRPSGYKLPLDSVAMFIPKTIPENATTGQYVLAVSKTDGTEIIVVLREGKIAECGYRRVGGQFVAVTPSQSPCNNLTCLTYQQKRCFDLSGQCVCICGTWFKP